MGGLSAGLGGMLGGSGGGLGGSGFDVKMHQIPVIGAFFDNPMEQYKLKAMGQAADETNAYRSSMGDARMNAMNQTLGQYAPVNNALMAMYGSSAYTPSLGASSPYGPEHSEIGSRIASPPQDTGIFGSGRKGYRNIVRKMGM